ncbi:hypothetical protein DN826_21385 [Stutzerimonas nosocomialis]|uniref:hypothetical protein n=1 Tax=Stutzerimonas nosocomialis TaxID=1056496 RepID=UPI001109165C|nr:hypothetical protein [Stutzerimonas nosocomialis]TLX52874.1 hypothetical protein DN826_21385 [Stutzerimonas nosocomialis]
MQKHFSITNVMRDKVADQLTVQAVAQHGPRIASDLAALNQQFWAKHVAAVEALPGLSKKHWAELIQAGAVTATASCQPTYMQPRKDNDPSEQQLVAVYKHHKEEARNALVYKVLESPAFEGVGRYLDQHRYNYHWIIALKSPTGAVPRLNQMNLITDPALESLALLVCSELTGVIDAAVAFRAQAMDVLQACRTSRQVEDLFPEAAKLLPRPVKNEKALAPTELAANVRNMLNQGVPPVVAQA